MTLSLRSRAGRCGLGITTVMMVVIGSWVSCSSTSPPDGGTVTFDAGGEAEAGPCVPEDNTDFCTSHVPFAPCGTLDASDNCGNPRSVACGACAPSADPMVCSNNSCVDCCTVCYMNGGHPCAQTADGGVSACGNAGLQCYTGAIPVKPCVCFNGV